MGPDVSDGDDKRFSKTYHREDSKDNNPGFNFENIDDLFVSPTNSAKTLPYSDNDAMKPIEPAPKVTLQELVGMYNKNQPDERKRFKSYFESEKFSKNCIVYSKFCDNGSIDVLMMASGVKRGKYVEELAAYSINNDEPLAQRATKGWIHEKTGHTIYHYSSYSASLIAFSGACLGAILSGGITHSWIYAGLGLLGVPAGIMAIDTIKRVSVIRAENKQNERALKQIRAYGKVHEGSDASNILQNLAKAYAIKGDGGIDDGQFVDYDIHEE